MFFRVKPAKGYRYLQIAESFREGGKVRQRVLATLGRLDVLQESGRPPRSIADGALFRNHRASCQDSCLMVLHIDMGADIKRSMRVLAQSNGVD